MNSERRAGQERREIILVAMKQARNPSGFVTEAFFVKGAVEQMSQVSLCWHWLILAGRSFSYNCP